MKYYDFPLAPNPRRVNLFVREKGLALETVEINLRAGEHLEAAFLAVNPGAMVPCLVLDDGTVLGETMAICRYLEALHPEPNLFGRTPREIGLVEMWSRRAELEGFLAMADALRNGEPRFANRALPGRRDHAQIPALVERGVTRARDFLDALDRALAGRDFLALERFSAADITAWVTVEFGARVGVRVDPARQPELARWYAAIGARPSVQGMVPAPA